MSYVFIIDHIGYLLSLITPSPSISSLSSILFSSVFVSDIAYVHTKCNVES